MPVIKSGKYTIKELIQMTNDSKYRNRFDYMKRDKISRVFIRKVKQFTPKKLTHPTYYMEVLSISTPQYYPYMTKKETRIYRKGKKEYYRKSQRTYKNKYTIYFRIWDWEGSINTKKWAIRLGEDKKWRKFNPRMIKSKKNPRGKFLSQGHANSYILGLNGDWVFRACYWFREAGHAYNVRYCGYKRPTISDQIFLCKHLIAFFNLLLQANILKDIPKKEK